MIRKIKVEVESNREAKLIESALQEKDVKAFTIIVAALKGYSPTMQSLMIQMAQEKLREDDDD